MTSGNRQAVDILLGEPTCHFDTAIDFFAAMELKPQFQ